MTRSSENLYMYFDREQWASLRNMQPMSLTAEEVQKLRGINDELSIDEVRDIYMPLPVFSIIISMPVSTGNRH